MKIVIANRYGFPDESATSRMVASLAFALQRQGHQVHLLSSRMRHDDVRKAMPRRETIRGVEMHRIWSTRFGRRGLAGRTLDYLTFHAAAGWWLLRALRRGDICVACTDPPLLGVTALLPAMIRRARLVNWIMDLFPEVAVQLGGRAGRLTGMAAWLRDRSLRRAAVNVAPMQRMADYLESRGLGPGKVTVLHHWSDGEAIVPMPPGESFLRREWGFSDKFVVGYSGNLGRAHDFTTVLAAAQAVDDPRIVFLFIGDGYRRRWLEAEVQRLGLDNIIFKPLQPREHLAASLAAIDVHLVSLLPELEPCVVPSKFYGIAAAGRPTLFVGDPAGEIATLVRGGLCGAVVALGDGARLAAVVQRLGRSPGLCAFMGRRARRLFDTRFTEDRGAADWIDLIARLPPPVRPAQASSGTTVPEPRATRETLP